MGKLNARRTSPVLGLSPRDEMRGLSAKDVPKGTTAKERRADRSDVSSGLVGILGGSSLYEWLSKRLVWVVLVVVALGVISAPPSVNDTTHEIQAVGTRWVYGKEILYVQVWSNHSPQTLFVGALYDRYVAPYNFAAVLFELIVLGVIALCIRSVYLVINNKKRQHSYVLVAFLGITILAPGIWQRGVTPVKLATLFFCLATAFYYKWRASKEGFWLFGKTSKNFRFIALAGLFLSLLIYTNPWLILLALPFLYDSWQFLGRNWKEWLRWASFLVLPATIELWIWYSVLAPRQLLSESLKSPLLDRYLQMTNGSALTSANMIVILLALGVVVCLALPQAARQNATKNSFAWLMIISALLTIFILGSGSIIYAPLLACCAGVAALNTQLDHTLRRRALTLVAVLIIPVLVQRFEYDASARLEALRLQLVSGHVVQRSGTNNKVLYFGKALGFHAMSGLSNPTPFYNTIVFKIDQERTYIDLESQFRGWSESNASLFVVVATSPEQQVVLSDRLIQYLGKHYEYAVDFDGYTVLKRL